MITRQKLLGFEAVTQNWTDYRTILGDTALALFEIVIRRWEIKNEMIFRLPREAKSAYPDALTQELQKNIGEARPQFQKQVENGLIHPLHVE